ncbi:hypothetical protein C494_18018 [Natronorubrum bangense JCM 10635]|uniref:Uncharacterized protein n=2 Tax=Natronorubrum bangense TaxID=61858 RepID=L9W6S3_9EURY|nr:hypothetical protein C494_18018 [Natronorubrum bangense JCM 10635]
MGFRFRPTLHTVNLSQHGETLVLVYLLKSTQLKELSSSMSNQPSGHDQDTVVSRERDGEDQDVDGTLEKIVPSLAGPIRTTGFWGAIVLPILYLPVLITGLSTSFEASLFLGLIILHLLALYVGHAHRRRESDQ